jgi:hypothetical protein
MEYYIGVIMLDENCATEAGKICVHLRPDLPFGSGNPRMPAGIRVCALPRRDSESAVRDIDTHSLHRIPIGAPNSLKYLNLSSYEFVLSSLFIFHPALRPLCSSAVYKFLYAEKSVKMHIYPQYLKYVRGA